MKAWYQSKTIWGAFVVILSSLLQLAGIDLGAEEQNQIAEAAAAITGAAGGLLALYGRLTATRAIARK